MSVPHSVNPNSGNTSNSELENEDLAAADEARLFKDIVIEEEIQFQN